MPNNATPGTNTSIAIIIDQIKCKGTIAITKSDILVTILYEDDSPANVESTENYERFVTFEELKSLDSSIDLNYSNLDDFPDIKQFRECFHCAQEIQAAIGKLHNYGKNFIYGPKSFFEIKEDPTLENLKHLKHQYKGKIQLQNMPPFLTLNDLIYFGYTFQAGKLDEKMIERMFPNFTTFFNKQIIDDYLNQREYNHPISLAAAVFNNFFEKCKKNFSYSSDSNTKGDFLHQNEIKKKEKENKKTKLRKFLTQHFISKNLIVLKVNSPIETLHLPVIISQIIKKIKVNPLFYELFYCYEDSNISSYLFDIENSANVPIPKYLYIVHPEFLSNENQAILKNFIKSRIVPIPDMSLHNIVIITSSDEFHFLEEYKHDITESELKILREKTTNQLATIGVSLVQSNVPGIGKSTYIEHELIPYKMNQLREEEKVDIEFEITHHFIVDGEQDIPYDIVSNPPDNTIRFVHLQLSDNIMSTGIRFWSYLNRLYCLKYLNPTKGAPMRTSDKLIKGKNHNIYPIEIIIEIPQIHRREFSIQNLNQFPIPIKNQNSTCNPPHDDIHLNLNLDQGEQQFGIYASDFNKIVDPPVLKLTEEEGKSRYVYKAFISICENNEMELSEYLVDMYLKIFKGELSNLSKRVLSYIEQYLNEYAIAFLNSLTEKEVQFVQRDYASFFILLTISAFYVYGLVPRSKPGITFMILQNMYSETEQNDSKERKRFLFVTSDLDNIRQVFLDFSYSNNLFDIKDLMKEGQERADFSKDTLRNIFSTSDIYKRNVENFMKNNPNSFIAKTKITIPTLYRASLLLNRIYLSQPAIPCGDTGCGKTSLVLLLFEYLRIPYNEQYHKLMIQPGKTLNCHGGITLDDVNKHLRQIPSSPQKHIIFFDEMNTSAATSYIEHLLLNQSGKGYPNFIFIGALNPWKATNAISKQLAKVGIPQNIKHRVSSMNLLNTKEKQIEYDMSEFMYHVNPPQEATKDIIVDFNPICISENEQESYKNRTKGLNYKYANLTYPEEECQAMESIIKNSAPNNPIIIKVINECILFIRTIMNERAVISYRDIERTMIIYKYLYNYEMKKNPSSKPEDIQRTVTLVTIYLSFILRLPHTKDLTITEENLDYIKDNANFFYSIQEESKIKEKETIQVQIRDVLLSQLEPIFESKSTLTKEFVTYAYKFERIYLSDTSIWRFNATFIHLFAMHICIDCEIPCFVVGMPGTSKSYAIDKLEQLYKQRGEKLLIRTYMSSKTSSPDGIKSHYYDAIYQQIKNEKEREIDPTVTKVLTLVFLDEMGNANNNPSHPLKFLHSILDEGLVLNKTGYKRKVPTIGVSNYSLDFANMNRGIVIFTDFPLQKEIINVFSDEFIRKKEKSLPNLDNLYDTLTQLKVPQIQHLFNSLWPKQEMPKTIALRSIYSIRQIATKKDHTLSDFNQLSREIFNAKRLLEFDDQSHSKLKNLPQVVRSTNIIPIKNEYKTVDNMQCFLDKIRKTSPQKSMCILTQNYEALEYFPLFDQGFHDYLDKSSNSQFDNFKTFLFAENFKDSPNAISDQALNVITQIISNPSSNEKIVFVGNHPVNDACLDLWNYMDKTDSSNTTRYVTLGSGFSSKFELKNTGFYSIMICNIDDYDDKDNPISLAFLDRTETLYLDWELISQYYLQYVKKDKMNVTSITSDDIKNESKAIIQELKGCIQYSNDPDKQPYFHLNIKNLYEAFHQQENPHLFNNNTLNYLVNERWSNGIKAVILTVKKITDYIQTYLPNQEKNMNDKSKILFKDDASIVNFESLKHEMNQISGLEFVIIQCSGLNTKSDLLHFAHLKHFFDYYQRDDGNRDKELNVFIIIESSLSTEEISRYEHLTSFRWPIFGMEEIHIYKELESPINKDFPMTFEELKAFRSFIDNIHQQETCNYDIFDRLFSKILLENQKELDMKVNNKVAGGNKEKVKSNQLQEAMDSFGLDTFSLIKMKANLNFDLDKTKDKFFSTREWLIKIINETLRTAFRSIIGIIFSSAKIDFFKKYNTNSKSLLEYFLECRIIDDFYENWDEFSKYRLDTSCVFFYDYFNILSSNPLIEPDMKGKKEVANYFINSIYSNSNISELGDNYITDLLLSQIIQIKEEKQKSKQYDEVISKYLKNSNNLKRRLFKYSPKYIIEQRKSFDFYDYFKLNRFFFFIGIDMRKVIQNLDKFNNEYLFKSVFFGVSIHDAETIDGTYKSDQLESCKVLFKQPKTDTNISRRVMMGYQNQLSKDPKYEILYNFNRRDSLYMNDNEILSHLKKLTTGELIDKENREPGKMIQSLIGLSLLNKSVINTYLRDVYKTINEFTQGHPFELPVAGINSDNFPQFESNENLKIYDDLFAKIHDTYSEGWNSDEIDESPPFSFVFHKEGETQQIPLIEQIQKMINGEDRDKYQALLECRAQHSEPLALFFLRRYCSDDQRSENKLEDLVMLLDPYYSQKCVLLHFLKILNEQKQDDLQYPVAVDFVPQTANSTSNNDAHKKNQIQFLIDDRIIFRQFVNQSTITFDGFRVEVCAPILSQFVWYHLAFHSPGYYPYIDILLKYSNFFLEFSVVVEIIESIIHLRHYLAFNPALLPILLNCTSIMPNSDCLVNLYELNYLHEYSSIQNKISSLKSFIESKSNELKSLTAYQQLQMLFDYYVPKYNEFIDAIHNVLDPNDKIKLDTIKLKDVLPNLLVKDFSTTGVLLSLLYIHISYDPAKINDEIQKIFMQNSEQFPLFYVEFTSSVDFMGFTKENYRSLLSVPNCTDFNFNVQTLTIAETDVNKQRYIYHLMVLFLITSFYKNPNDLLSISTFIDLGANREKVENVRNFSWDGKEMIKYFYSVPEKYPLSDMLELLPDQIKQWLENKIPKSFT